MSPDFSQLERKWMSAVQTRDAATLEQMLDESFVCTAWSSTGELTSRAEYIGSVDAAEFGGCHVDVYHVQQLDSIAIVRCLLTCDCTFGQRSWSASFLVTDVWVRQGKSWRAVSRHASIPLGQWPAMNAQRAGTFDAADPEKRRCAEGA